MYKVRVETQFKVYHFFMESYEFMRLISKTDETEEFKVGEIHFLRRKKVYVPSNRSR